jgi:hypothetical protein
MAAGKNLEWLFSAQVRLATTTTTTTITTMDAAKMSWTFSNLSGLL